MFATGRMVGRLMQGGFEQGSGCMNRIDTQLTLLLSDPHPTSDTAFEAIPIRK